MKSLHLYTCRHPFYNYSVIHPWPNLITLVVSQQMKWRMRQPEAQQQNTGQNFILFSELTSTILLCRAVILFVDTWHTIPSLSWPSSMWPSWPPLHYRTHIAEIGWRPFIKASFHNITHNYKYASNVANTHLLWRRFKSHKIVQHFCHDFATLQIEPKYPLYCKNFICDNNNSILFYKLEE